MRESFIIIEPFNLISILECTVYKKVNDHFTAKVVGYIPADEADETVMYCASSTNVSICIRDEDGKKNCLFTGLIDNLSLKSENGLKKLTINAISHTSLLDKKEMVRTFQNGKLTYKEVAQFISSQNSGSLFIYTKGKTEQIGGMVTQYQETDWSFLKRMASRLNTVLVSDCKNENICLCFGIPQKSGCEHILPIIYSIVKNSGEYTLKKKHGVLDYNEQDAMEYIVESRDILELCAAVSFMGLPLFVYQIATRLEGNELIHTYYLRSLSGFKTIPTRNEKIIGTSITGKVLDVEHDLVKVRIDSDNDRPDGVAKWFLYSTVYSSPDGTGWYCMPEKGDTVRVYFPDEEENNAYVISAMHLGAVGKLRKEPDEKSIRTIHDKEVRFTPTKILITNNKGMSITLDDKKGITIKSNKKINLTSNHSVDIVSGGDFKVSADQGVYLTQNCNSLVVRNGIREYGMNIEHR